MMWARWASMVLGLIPNRAATSLLLLPSASSLSTSVSRLVKASGDGPACVYRISFTRIFVTWGDRKGLFLPIASNARIRSRAASDFNTSPLAPAAHSRRHLSRIMHREDDNLRLGLQLDDFGYGFQ